MKNLSLVLMFTLIGNISLASDFNADQYVRAKGQEYSVVKTNPYFASSMLALSHEKAEKLKKELSQIHEENKNKTASEIAWTRLKYATQKQLSCRLADAVIIVNGVAETVPLGVNLAPKALTPSNDFEMIEINDVSNWINSLLGGGLDSVWRVVVETTSSFDSKKIEAEIAKSYPSTTIVARKVKGDESTCYKLTLIVDLLKDMQSKAQN